ncbi:MAG: hypothetical protein KAI24_16090 [Planctomycetes bacterium]|nr:hypothetical protein [Planctomycetota bacterium]
MKQKLKDALHRFKIEAFKMSHGGAEEKEDVAKEIFAHTSEALENAYHFHFQDGKEVNPHRVETFQMIKSVTLETILPPVVEKLMRRITVLEHTNRSMIQLLDELMEALSEE